MYQKNRTKTARLLILIGVLALTALTPAFSQSPEVPAELELDTLYNDTLNGPKEHTLELPRRGLYGMFVAGQVGTEVSISLPDGSVRRQEFTPEQNNFLFFDVRRSGTAEVSFRLTDPGLYDDFNETAYVIAGVELISLDEEYRGQISDVVLWSEPSTPMGMAFFGFEASDEELVTIVAEGVGSDFSFIAGSENAMSSSSQSYVEGWPEDTAITEIVTQPSALYGILVIDERGHGGAPTEEATFRFERSELVRLDRRELLPDETLVDDLYPEAEYIAGRRGIPYRYRGRAGEDVAFILESDVFDTFLVVEFPGGAVLTDDDGAYNTNSALFLTLPESGDYIIYASSFSGSESGIYSLIATDHPSAEEYIADAADSYGEEWGEEPDFFFEDRVVDVQDIRIGDRMQGEITEEGSIVDGKLTTAYHLELSRPQSITVEVSSWDFDTTVAFVTGQEGVEYYNDDGGSDTDSFLRVPNVPAGTHVIYVSSFDGQVTGSFEIVVDTYEAGPPAEEAEAELLKPGPLYEDEITVDSPFLGDSLVEVFEFEVNEGDGPVVTMRSDEFDTYLTVITPDGYEVTDDDSAGGEMGTDSQVTIGDATGGIYRVYAGSFSGDVAGSFTISLDFDDWE